MAMKIWQISAPALYLFREERKNNFVGRLTQSSIATGQWSLPMMAGRM